MDPTDKFTEIAKRMQSKHANTFTKLRDQEIAAATQEFVKHDAGKARFDLLDPEFEHECAEVLTSGAERYGAENWKQAEPQEARRRYYAALRRHLNAWYRGEPADPDSARSHLAHAYCCLQFLYYYDRAARK